jgi:hypothetical protein
MSNEHHLKCKCSAFEAVFNTPPRIVFNCQCHSCVAAIAAIESKDSFNGTSMKCNTPSDGDNSGAAIAIYKSNNVTVTKCDENKVAFVKVGDDGKIARPYCTECGTVLFNVWAPNWCAANRNALTTGSDGTTTPYEPSKEVMNVNCKSSFDNTKISNPKHNTVPMSMLFKFIPLIAGLGCDGSNAKDEGGKLMPDDISKVESVPITWE